MLSLTCCSATPTCCSAAGVASLGALTGLRNLKFDLARGHELTDEQLVQLSELRLTSLSLPPLNPVSYSQARGEQSLLTDIGITQSTQWHEAIRRARLLYDAGGWVWAGLPSRLKHVAAGAQHPWSRNVGTADAVACW